MKTLLKSFVVLHIRLANRKIFGVDFRQIINCIIVFLSLLFIAQIFFASNIRAVVENVLILFLVLANGYLWILAWPEADIYIKRAKELEIMHTKYKLDE